MIYPMVLNDADADELTQEVFMKVIRNISRFKGNAKFSTWLYKITMNTVRSFFRSKGRNPVEHHEEPPEVHDYSNDPVEYATACEMSVRVEKALAGLSPILRSAIVLTSLNGLSVREAAKAEGCIAATMYWRVHEARRILKSDLLSEA
jgi:RNA polymerase sigma-70 factor (ECF subfamily)